MAAPATVGMAWRGAAMNKSDRTICLPRGIFQPPDVHRCDGDVLFGFTVKACDKPATRRLWCDEREVYWFCEEHYQKMIQGTTEEVQP
jgi:hypothetical protein